MGTERLSEEELDRWATAWEYRFRGTVMGDCIRALVAEVRASRARIVELEQDIEGWQREAAPVEMWRKAFLTTVTIAGELREELRASRAEPIDAQNEAAIRVLVENGWPVEDETDFAAVLAALIAARKATED